MTKQTEQKEIRARYRWSKAWNATPFDGFVQLSGGADLVLDTDKLSTEQQENILLWAATTTETFERPSNLELGVLFDQFVSLGAIKPITPVLNSAIGISWLGDPWNELIKALQTDHLITEDLSNVETMLLVRTNSSWSEALDQLPNFPSIPYLFVDTAYHHTLCVGPFAVPKETACAGCLAGRVRERWGDQSPPDEPNIQEYSSLVSAILGIQLTRISAGQMDYVNSVSTWDLETGHSRREPIYRVPRCPYCSANVNGRLNLPWKSS